MFTPFGARRKLLTCACLVAVIMGSARPAGAEGEASSPSDGEAVRAFATGATVAGLALAVGGGVFASNRSDTSRIGGIYVMEGGLTLAPLVSYAMLGDWRAGAMAALPPAASSAGMVVFLTLDPHAVTAGNTFGQYTFSLLLAATVFSSMFEVSRVLPAGRPVGSRVSIVPSVGPRQVGLQIGGRL
jgi:hypothetical protein